MIMLCTALLFEVTSFAESLESMERGIIMFPSVIPQKIHPDLTQNIML